VRKCGYRGKLIAWTSIVVAPHLKANRTTGYARLRAVRIRLRQVRSDAAELAEMLQFLNGWLARDPARLGASLEEFVGHPAYNIGQLRDDLERFTFLLGGSDGGPLFG
jgi:hypothetical protein